MLVLWSTVVKDDASGARGRKVSVTRDNRFYRMYTFGNINIYIYLILRPSPSDSRSDVLVFPLNLAQIRLQIRPSIMIQTGLIQSAHSDLITNAAYDFYGLRLATCSLDQR